VPEIQTDIEARLAKKYLGLLASFAFEHPSVQTMLALSERSLGNFVYDKSHGTCLVRVYAMKVAKVREHWDEERVRERRWFPIDQAADVCGRDAVARLIRKLAVALYQ